MINATLQLLLKFGPTFLNTHSRMFVISLGNYAVLHGKMKNGPAQTTARI